MVKNVNPSLHYGSLSLVDGTGSEYKSASEGKKNFVFFNILYIIMEVNRGMKKLENKKLSTFK